MAVLWLVGRRIGNHGVVDAGWTGLVSALAAFFALNGPGTPERRLLIASLFGIWGLRLGTHLIADRIIGRPEDGRYARLRCAWGDRAEQRFFWFYQAQAVAALFFAMPALIASTSRTPQVQPLEWLAVGLWTIAVAGETAADVQLRRFKARQHRGSRTCRDGLWRYSRHPNYFFEWLVWVAYALFATASSWGFVAFACPAVMLYLLFRVTGIPATEAQALASRGDDYREYQATTSAFVPWRPRESSLPGHASPPPLDNRAGYR